MAFPRELISAAPLASGNIVEDMQLGIDLAIAGRPPLFCSAARVRSELPATNSAAASQRTRWIHGHLNTLLNQTPRLLVAAIRQRRMDLLGLALEVSVPPLSLLTLFGVVTCCVMTMACLFGGPVMPAVLSLSIGAMGLSALALAYACFGRQYLPLSGLLAVPLELASRLSVLIRFLYRPQAAWIRTARRHAN
jgi:cellulose synthase/poly-beta-1,6-N-acetylglucosamine synthase-like glycosyltransferase